MPFPSKEELMKKTSYIKVVSGQALMVNEVEENNGVPKEPLQLKKYTTKPVWRPLCPFHNPEISPDYTSSGITGRGLLGKWGPNFAGDPVVFMTKKLSLKDIQSLTCSTIFPADVNPDDIIKKAICSEMRCVLTVSRDDTKDKNTGKTMLCLPGGMVDVHNGEKSSAAVKREFAEEVLCIMKFLKTDTKEEEERKKELEGALNYIMTMDEEGNSNLDKVIDNEQLVFEVEVNKTKRTVSVEGKDKEEFVKLLTYVQGIFNEPTFVCNGFVEDPRNTDNAWMETCVYAFDVDNYSEKDKFNAKLTEIQNAGSVGCDEGNAVWVPVDLAIQPGVLYASHSKYVNLAVQKLKPGIVGRTKYFI